MREAVERLAATAPLLVMKEDLFTDLVGEMGGVQEAVSWLVELAANVGHPIALHVEGTTTFLSPPGWSSERLQGWAAGHAETLEQAFGKTLSVSGPEAYIEKDVE